MPKQVKARAAQDKREEQAVRKLARSQHAPADWIWHACMVVESWAGKSPDQIAAELHCHPQTVRIHVARFNQQGLEGLGVQPGSGRKSRLTEAERSVIVALPSQIRRIRLAGGSEVAADAQLGHTSRQGLRRTRTTVVTHYTEPPEGSTTSHAPTNWIKSIPRTFDPAPGWSADGHRIKAPMDA